MAYYKTSAAKEPTALEKEIEERGFGDMLRECCQKYGALAQDVCGGERDWASSMAKHELWYRIHSERGWPMTSIGRMFGVDHATVGKGIRKIESMKPPEATPPEDGQA